MSAATDPGVCGSLQTQVETQLDRWIKPCYTKPCEHITVRANESGEVWLSGLVCNAQLVAEAMRLIREMPGARHVFNQVTVMYTGQSIVISR